MSVTSQTGSLQADSDGGNDSIDNVSAISNTDANTVVVESNNNDNDASRVRRRRWKLFRQSNNGNGDATTSNSESDGGMFLSCRCKGGVNAGCLVICSAILELIGNTLGLVYGIGFIQGACKFYTLESDADRQQDEYNERLKRVLFLEKHRVGFIGLLATCLVGLTVSILMYFGTVYKSWKSLRAAMSLLVSICLAHILLAAFYLRDNELSATLAAVPFRVFEILLMWMHISIYKRKKLADKMKAESDTLGLELGDSQNNTAQKSWKGKREKPEDKRNKSGGKNSNVMADDDDVNKDIMKLLEDHINKKRHNQLVQNQDPTWDEEFQRKLKQASLFV